MLYDVTLKIGYKYESASDHARNALHLLPVALNDQQSVLSRMLVIEPMPAERRDRIDFFGNVMTMVAFHQPISAIALSLRARIERFEVGEPLDFSPWLSVLADEITSIHSLDADAPHHFSGPSPRIPCEPEISAFARDAVVPGASVMQAVLSVGRALHREMTFNAKATTVDTPAIEAFRNRKGVCQDFTNIMIAGLRGIGIPAGYVSGFLRTKPPAGQPRLEGADAMHAWVRAWCGLEMGWLEYDPTNDIIVGADHIVVARGRDYSDVSPVKGAIRTAGGQKSSHTVDVVPVGNERSSG